MRKICIINQKGGVGKTTTAVSLAAGLSRKDKKVLLIDMDAQSHVSFSLSTDSNKTIYDFLIENAEASQCITHLGKNLDSISASAALIDAEKIMVQEADSEYTLTEKMKGIEDYDYIIIDCPPSMNTLTLNSLIFCDEAIIPSATDILSFEGLKKMIKHIKKINSSFGHDLKISKIVPTMHDARSKICKKVLKEMQNEFYEIVSDPIRVNSKLKEAPLSKKSIFSYDKNSRGAKDYALLVKSVMNDEAIYNGKKAVAKKVAQAA